MSDVEEKAEQLKREVGPAIYEVQVKAKELGVGLKIFGNEVTVVGKYPFVESEGSKQRRRERIRADKKRDPEMFEEVAAER